LPVEDLDTARARHSALGFTVAADARHPFGTENACVFFADGTYLEPLALPSVKSARKRREGNVFVARDQAYRFRRVTTAFQRWWSARRTRMRTMTASLNSACRAATC
jgi:hypothetical protein